MLNWWLEILTTPHIVLTCVFLLLDLVFSFYCRIIRRILALYPVARRVEVDEYPRAPVLDNSRNSFLSALASSFPVQERMDPRMLSAKLQGNQCMVFGKGGNSLETSFACKFIRTGCYLYTLRLYAEGDCNRARHRLWEAAQYSQISLPGLRCLFHSGQFTDSDHI